MLSARLYFTTKFKSKELIILNYSHFFMGPDNYPLSPYTWAKTTPDPDMLTLSLLMSF